MSTIGVIYVATAEDPVTIQDVKNRVLAVGVGLFFTFLINYSAQAYGAFVKKQEGKRQAMKKLLETSQVMYWYGIASIFSIYPPDYFGVHCAVFAYLTILLVIGLHVTCFVNKAACGRSLWAIFYVIYHLMIMLWMIFNLIIGYIWSNQNYGTAA